MRLKKKEAWLFGTPLLIFALLGGINLWRRVGSDATNEVVVSIGLFKIQILQERAAFERLSAEIKQHPKANIYRIRSSDPDIPERDVLVYMRYEARMKMPGVLLVDRRKSDHFFRLPSRATERVIDQDIHDVANQDGDFRDVLLSEMCF